MKLPIICGSHQENLRHLAIASGRDTMYLLVLTELLTQIFFINHAVKYNKPKHWLYILLIPWVGFIIYFFTEFITEDFELLDSSDADTQPKSVKFPKGYDLSYTSHGKLFHLSEEYHLEQIQSPFGQKIIDQTARLHQKNEWNATKQNTDAKQVNITSVSMCPDDSMFYYILKTDSTGGLFAYDSDINEETRLFHRENFAAKDLDINRKTKEFICSQQSANGTSSIILISEDGKDIKEITGGDSIDDSPSWIPGDQRRILFQSTGIARNKAGNAAGRGTTTTQALDLDNNRMTTVLEDDRYDFLQPHISIDGYLYYIRRPYKENQCRQEAPVIDFLLFPFRLLRAIFNYLNFFSLSYSTKTLATASGSETQADDLKTVVLKGTVINREKAINSGVKIMGVPSLVPSSWELVRRDEDNKEEVIAKNVAAFDIGHDGTIIYSNGYGVFKLDDQNKPELVLKNKLIEDLVIG